MNNKKIYVQMYESFIHPNKYEYININNDAAEIFYQVPFSLFYNQTLLGDIEDNEVYKLAFGDRFVYDYISDDDIKKCILSINNGEKDNVDLSKPWEDQTYHSRMAKDIHIERIAQLVLNIENKLPIEPISLWIDEVAPFNDCVNYIMDGNHRIRALQYLKYKYMPAYVYGSHSKYLIEKIKSV